MLKHLHIRNIILVEQASIPFNQGLNILTGETGSGKSAIMHGLGLAVGARTDTGLIRKGCDTGIVEAVFEILHLGVASLLEEGGIDHEPGQELIIRREISQSGKGRVFINNQMAQLAFLRKLGQYLVQIVGQHANQSLLSLDYHRHLIDLFGNLQNLLSVYQQSFDHEKNLREKLESLIQEESRRLREIDICRRELEELDEAQLKPYEDEELFAEFSLLSNAEELSSRTNEINQALSGERHPLLANLIRQKQNLEAVVQFDPTLKDTLQAFQNAILELQEIAYTLRNYQNGLHFDPLRLQDIDARLSSLTRLKKKYGGTVEEMINYAKAAKNRLDVLENRENEIGQLQVQLKEAEQLKNRYAEELSNARQECAMQFEKAITQQLRFLNMAKAEFQVEMTRQKATREGIDRIEFYLQPNVGEHRISLRDGVSGGEMSRILLALQTLLAGKEKVSTLIFDEVDANIGGETATKVGKKLNDISREHQVICITHFPQVAGQANHHLRISKEEQEGRTKTVVVKLGETDRQYELARMSGVKSS